MIRYFSRISRRKAARDIFRYKDIDFWPCIKGYIFDILTAAYPRIKANARRFKRLCKNGSVRLVVMRNDLKEMERTVIEAAGELGVQTAVVQHGLVGDLTVSNALCADKTAVWGGATVDWFKRLGYGDDRFAITGNPAYDALYERASGGRRDYAKGRVCEKLNLDFSKKIVLFLTSSNFMFSTSAIHGYEMRALSREILKALKSLGGDTQLVIKAHPYDIDLSSYEDIINGFNSGIRAVAVKEFDTFELLDASELVIMCDSTAGLEALILDKPLIAINMSTNYIPYAQQGVAIGVERFDEIGPAIKAGLYDEGAKKRLEACRKRFVFDYAYKIDGNAGNRVRDFILKPALDKKKIL